MGLATMMRATAQSRLQRLLVAVFLLRELDAGSWRRSGQRTRGSRVLG